MDEKQMFPWMNPKLEVRETDEYGGEIRPEFKDEKKFSTKRNPMTF